MWDKINIQTQVESLKLSYLSLHKNGLIYAPKCVKEFLRFNRKAYIFIIPMYSKNQIIIEKYKKKHENAFGFKCLASLQGNKTCVKFSIRRLASDLKIHTGRFTFVSADKTSLVYSYKHLIQK